jgi:hypothetical protein
MTGISPPAPSTARDPTYVALAGVVLAYAAINSFIAFIWPDGAWDAVEALLIGGMVLEPMMFGLWTALGAGSILTRLSLAVPCLLFVFVAPGYVPANFADTQRSDFIATVLTGFAMYAVTLALFLIFRRFTRFRIQRPERDHPNGTSGIHFSMKYLFAVITIFAIALGFTTQLKFQTQPPPPSLFGPDFFLRILVIGGAVIYAALLPTLVVPLSILHGRPSRSAVLWPLALWLLLMASLVFVLIDAGDVWSTVGFVLLAQLGACILGAATALPLRVCGLRMTRPDRHTAPPSAVV